MGSDTTEAMFKYIDNKTERAVESAIKTLATKDDLAKAAANLKDVIANVGYDFRKEISESKADNIKWIFIFWIGQVGATLAFILLFIKK